MLKHSGAIGDQSPLVWPMKQSMEQKAAFPRRCFTGKGELDFFSNIACMGYGWCRLNVFINPRRSRGCVTKEY